MTRVFDAPRTLVFDAFSKPELLKQWLLGPPGWSMVVCEIARKVGDRYRYAWRHANGNEMGMGGVLREFVPPERIVATEKFDQSWYPGEAVGTIVLAEKSGKTTLTQTILYESREARDVVLKSPMEQAWLRATTGWRSCWRRWGRQGGRQNPRDAVARGRRYEELVFWMRSTLILEKCPRGHRFGVIPVRPAAREFTSLCSIRPTRIRRRYPGQLFLSVASISP